MVSHNHNQPIRREGVLSDGPNIGILAWRQRGRPASKRLCKSPSEVAAPPLHDPEPPFTGS